MTLPKVLLDLDDATVLKSDIHFCTHDSRIFSWVYHDSCVHWGSVLRPAHFDDFRWLFRPKTPPGGPALGRRGGHHATTAAAGLQVGYGGSQPTRGIGEIVTW